MRHLKLLMLLLGGILLAVLYFVAKFHTSYTKIMVPSTESRYSPEQHAEIEAFDAEIVALDLKKRQMPTVGDNWLPYPEEIVKQILATKVHATDLADRLGCHRPDPDLLCTRLLYLESQLRLELANNDIKTMRKHAEEAAPQASVKVETGLVVVDRYIEKLRPPLFLRDLAYHGTGYLKMIVLREAIDRLAGLLRFGPRVNPLGNL